MSNLKQVFFFFLPHLNRTTTGTPKIKDNLCLSVIETRKYK